MPELHTLQLGAHGHRGLLLHMHSFQSALMWLRNWVSIMRLRNWVSPNVAMQLGQHKGAHAGRVLYGHACVHVLRGPRSSSLLYSRLLL